MAETAFYQSLNGAWQLAAPETDDMRIPTEFPHAIPVPGLVDLAPDYNWRAPRFHYYSRLIEPAPRDGREHLDLILGQSMWTTTVWCNGRFSAQSNDCFLPQRFALDPAPQGDAATRIVVRIGQKDTLPTRHNGGNDYERLEWIPGIYGDAKLHAYGSYEITGVLIVPAADLGGCMVRTRIRRAAAGKAPALVRLTIRNAAGLIVASGEGKSIALDQNVEQEIAITLRWQGAEPWHPEKPVLYELIAEAIDPARGEVAQDATERRFGLRRFAVEGRDFLLNGEKIKLRGTNVAFHRLLGDPSRGALPWDLDFARRALITLPREHNMNCLRLHIGSMYEPWYDEADAAGMLLVEEWPFWNVTASHEDVHSAFTRWIWTLNHHPSIIMWDPGNECDLEPITKHVIPVLKELDPARAWMHAEVDEEHPYHWALIPLHPRRAMGFTRSHEAIRDSARPVSVNEFGWFWIDGDGQITSLTESVRQRWLPDGLSQEEHLEYQAWLVKECTEVWRRYEVASIQPFVYLSASSGLTANWFMGPIGDLRAKPVLRALAEAIAPLGVSWEVNSRHYLPKGDIQAKLFVFNDHQQRQSFRILVGLASPERNWLEEPKAFEVTLDACSLQIIEQLFQAPRQAGSYRLLARVETSGIAGASEKIIDVMAAPIATVAMAARHLLFIGAADETYHYLRQNFKMSLVRHADSLLAVDSLIIVGNAWSGKELAQFGGELDDWLRRGGRLVLLQPDCGLASAQTMEICPGISLSVASADDGDAGGYDTVVLPTADTPAELLDFMPRLHLGYFNGGLGNITAEESDISLGEEAERWLVCGLNRKRNAVIARRHGAGLIIASRLQFQGRLMPSEEADRIGEETFPRLPDPLAQQLLLNLLAQ
jgi:hypothetical protein